MQKNLLFNKRITALAVFVCIMAAVMLVFLPKVIPKAYAYAAQDSPDTVITEDGATYDNEVHLVVFTVEGAEFFALEVEHGSRLAEQKDIKPIMQIFSLSGYTETEQIQVMYAAIKSDTTVSVQADKSTLNAILFIVWFMKWWWTLLIALAAIVGVVGYVVYRKKKS